MRLITGKKIIICAGLIVAGLIPARSQNVPTVTNQKDSAFFSKPYPYILPFMGEKVHNAQIRLPFPVGIMFNTLTGEQNLAISDIALGFGRFSDPSPPEMESENNAGRIVRPALFFWLWICIQSAYICGMHTDTIIALSTPPGVGAIGVIRLSGPEAITLTNAVFHGTDLNTKDSHTIHFGTLRDGDKIIDEVLVSLFIAPRSFTRENVVEISCHGSPWIIRQVIQMLLKQGARLAKAGEFTQRAFLNGQFDLAQAEAVADLINADSEAAHKAALQQMRGGFSDQIKALREELIHFASMIELELDFGEEDVEFADRDDLKALINSLLAAINPLIDSFQLGNVIKNGIPTVIAGKPNAGKSTLLNALLNEEKAIVSNIPGTTRDFIEDEINLGGVVFRFIDTAGLRETEDAIEKIGVARTEEQMKKASLILYLIDLENDTVVEMNRALNRLENLGIPFLMIGNKADAAKTEMLEGMNNMPGSILISADRKENLEGLKERILEVVHLEDFKTGDTIVTNVRHYDNLFKTRQALQDVLTGLDNNVTGDFLAMDIRQALHYLGEITGQITTDDLLANIFSKFCIGK